MLQSLLSLVVETLLSVVGGAVVKILGLENAVELATAVVGLGFIAIGLAAYLLGH